MNKEEVFRDISLNVIKAFKNVITQEGLIDSGLLLNTTDIVITSDYRIEFSTQDYYKILDDKYSLTEKIFNDQNFIIAEKQLEDYVIYIITNAFEL